MSEKPDRVMCSDTVFDRDTRWPRTYPCSRAAKVEREGRHYCLIHDPVRKKAKDAERSAVWKAEWDKKMKRLALEQAAPDLLAACKDVLNYWDSTGFSECEPDCNCIVESVRAAIAKAEQP